MEKDPVCGMSVEPSSALTAEFEGRTYHFCSEGCREAFLEDPHRYLHRSH